jgi:hypothetical protein
MARIVKGTGIVIDELKEIQALLKDYPRAIRRKYMKAAFNAVTRPAMQALKKATPRGPTGNLKRSVVKKASPNYAIVGYSASKKKDDPTAKGFHQNLLEYGGRKVRTTKSGRIASTFNNPGQGRGGAVQTRITKQGRNRGQLKTVSPRFPKGFLKSAPLGQKVTLGKMPVGGRTGQPPIRTAFAQAQGQIRSVLKQQMSTVLERANKDMARRARPKNA